MAAKLSILIPSLQSRRGLLTRLMDILKPQLGPEVEVCIDVDEGQVSIGEKRNRLLQRATGDYVVFVDDDDRVSADYVSSILNGIDRRVDVVCIQGIITKNGLEPVPFFDDLHQLHGTIRVDGQESFTRGVQHLDAIRRDLALTVRYPESYFGEDYEYSVALDRSGVIKTSYQIDHPVYFYDLIYPKERFDEPKFAVVVPCYNHVYTTHKSIESLLATTAYPNLLLVLVDDDSTDETSLYAADLNQRLGSRRFHYHKNLRNEGVNASWNTGIAIAKARGAQQIAVCNNDLLYAPDWDVAIRKSLEDPAVGIVSPLSTFGPATPPDWPKGNERNVNPAGYLGYLPILGCCFAARTETFDLIGPVPASLRIYFGDNWFAAAAQAHDLLCGYEDESYIHHLFCVTTRHLKNDSIWEFEGPEFDRLMLEKGWTMAPLVEEVAV